MANIIVTKEIFELTKKLEHEKNYFKEYIYSNEQLARDRIIDPIIDVLKWNTCNYMCIPEYYIGKIVDYALIKPRCSSSSNHKKDNPLKDEIYAFVEAKHPNPATREEYLFPQLLEYCWLTGTRCGILTTGFRW